MTEPLNWQGKGRSAQQRIYDYSIPEPNSGCWLWVGSLNACGYGTMGYKRKSQLAHRVSFSVFIGRFPKNKKVLHWCDTPCCVNPEHLFIGTQKDNVHDMERKNRSYHPAGEDHGKALLTAQQVREIRAAKKSRGLAKQYGVGQHVIKYARRAGTWKNI
jgi:hypothetical protein